MRLRRNGRTRSGCAAAPGNGSPCTHPDWAAAPAPQIGIVVEPTPTAQISSLLLSAYGLTGAQSRVVALVIRGHSTRQIVGELHISANTVQEHLTAAFDKFGVRSRRELVAAMLTGRPG